MNKKRQTIMAILLCVFIFAGCSANKSAADEKDEYLHNYQVQLYYANAAYVETGDEDLPKMNDPFEVKIRSLPQDVYADTIEYLKHPPADPGYVTMIPEGLIVNGVELEDGTAVVDLSGKELSGGSMQEMFIIAQIVNSLLISFDEIDSVQFTVDGEVVETLMGHIMATEPFLFQDF